jgi:hypothetical protein
MGMNVFHDLKGAFDAGVGALYGASGQGEVYVRSPAGSWRREVAVPSTQRVRGLHVTPDGFVFAVDENANFSRRDLDGGWTPEANVNGTGNAMSGRGELVYAAARVSFTDGALYRRDPSLGWLEALRTANPLEDVWVAPDASVFMITGREVLRYEPPDCPYPTAPIADEFEGAALSPAWRLTPGAPIMARFPGRSCHNWEAPPISAAIARAATATRRCSTASSSTGTSFSMPSAPRE